LCSVDHHHHHHDQHDDNHDRFDQGRLSAVTISLEGIIAARVAMIPRWVRLASSLPSTRSASLVARHGDS